MSEHVLSATTYVIILIALLLLTALTMYVSFLDIPGAWHTIIGLTIGVTKATLVVLFFMHALHSPRVTWCVILVACSWLTILLVLALVDYSTRGLIPFTPGH